jgi:putative addiction module component (TIGR02574 family)
MRECSLGWVVVIYLDRTATARSDVMSSPLSPIDIQQLNPSEKLDLIAQLWDSLPNSLESLPIPDSHREELDRRLAAAAENPRAAIPWEEVKAYLRQES